MLACHTTYLACMLPWVPCVHAPLGGRTGQVLSVQINSVGSARQALRALSLCQPPMDSAEQALPAQARPVSQSGPLTSDYPACGVPQCLIAAAKPRVVVPGSLWEVHAGLALEAFMCCHGPHEVTDYNFAAKAGKWHPKARTRKKVALATVKQYHTRHRTFADALELTGAGRAQSANATVWSGVYACRGDGNCLGGLGKCRMALHISATRKQAENGLWCVRLSGSHVAKGATAVPPLPT